ncbi:MAG: hypothetical protein HRU34_11795 [Richelia sp.]|nr:hypothetical protein [Richelia sp.]CDN17272.1 hypothetical protein RintRC_2233 [Richelia intracellularis]
MSHPFKIENTQTEEELKKLLQTARSGNQKEKLHMLWWVNAEWTSKGAAINRETFG